MITFVNIDLLEYFFVQRGCLPGHDRRRMLRHRHGPSIRPRVEDRDDGLPQGLRDGTELVDGPHRPGHRRPNRSPEDGVSQADVRAHREPQNEAAGDYSKFDPINSDSKVTMKYYNLS